MGFKPCRTTDQRNRLPKKLEIMSFRGALACRGICFSWEQNEKIHRFARNDGATQRKALISGEARESWQGDSLVLHKHFEFFPESLRMNQVFEQQPRAQFVYFRLPGLI